MDRLAELRERHALTLRELSEMSGVAADTINQIELGHRKPRPSTLRKLARALEVDVEEFFKEPALAGKAKAPREAGPGETRDLDNEDRSVRDIAHSEARQQFEKDIKALRRTHASEGLDRATQISDPYDLGVYNALKRRDPGDLAGGLLDAERDILWQAHRIKELEQENAQLRQQPARQQEEAREETQRA